MRFGYFLASLFVAIQFVSFDDSKGILTSMEERIQAPKEIMDILNRSCADCHSNSVEYPWYDMIAPISWYAQTHVRRGREVFNIDRWSSYKRAKKIKILKGIPDAIRIRMPLPSYLWLHKEAKLSDNDREVLRRWAKDLQLKME